VAAISAGQINAAKRSHLEVSGQWLHERYRNLGTLYRLARVVFYDAANHGSLFEPKGVFVRDQVPVRLVFGPPVCMPADPAFAVSPQTQHVNWLGWQLKDRLAGRIARVFAISDAYWVDQCDVGKYLGAGKRLFVGPSTRTRILRVCGA